MHVITYVQDWVINVVLMVQSGYKHSTWGTCTSKVIDRSTRHAQQLCVAAGQIVEVAELCNIDECMCTKMTPHLMGVLLCKCQVRWRLYVLYVHVGVLNWRSICTGNEISRRTAYSTYVQIFIKRWNIVTNCQWNRFYHCISSVTRVYSARESQ